MGLVIFAILLVGCAAMGSGTTHQPKSTTMRVAIRFGNVVPFKELRQRLSSDIQKASDGGIQVKFLDYEELFPVQDSFDAVSQGRVEAAISIGLMWRKREGAFGILAGAPFGLPPDQHLTWLTQPGIIRLHDDLYAKYNLRSFPYAVIGPEGDISVVPIQSLDDFKLTTWRLPGYARHIVKKLGVKVKDLPSSKVKRALKTGEIHATDNGIPETDLYAGFFDLAKYYYYPSWSQPSMTMEMIVNLEFLNNLPPEQRLALETACRSTAIWWYRQNDRRNQEALAKIRSKGVTVQPWPTDIIKAARNIWERELEKESKEDAQVNEVSASLDRFRKQPSTEPYQAVASAQASTSPVTSTAATPTTGFKGSKTDVSIQPTPPAPPTSQPAPIAAPPTAPPAPTLAIGTERPKAYKPRLFVLAIGVSRYKDSNLNLNFATVDAEAVALSLKSQSDRVYKEIRVKVLTDEEATRTQILQAMGTFLGRAVSSDVVVIFVAGHGVKKEDTGSFFFLPYLANVNNLLDQGLSWYAFEEAVNTLKQRVQNIVLILDTCHAGAMQLSMRGLRGGQDLSRPFARKGYYALAAAYPDESAAENDQWGHGAFTYAILEGLRGQADVNKDGLIDVLELFHYVESRVADLTGGRQHPHFHMGGGSLPLSALR
jgi:TRAP-type mannitol/chloroaromatic compound transport system substrate-binding protein